MVESKLPQATCLTAGLQNMGVTEHAQAGLAHVPPREERPDPESRFARLNCTESGTIDGKAMLSFTDQPCVAYPLLHFSVGKPLIEALRSWEDGQPCRHRFVEVRRAWQHALFSVFPDTPDRVPDY